MAENDGYNKPQRELAKRQITELLLQGYSVTEISEKLQIPLRTCERYVHELFAAKNDLLQQPTKEHKLTTINVFKDQLIVQARKVLEMANDENQDGDVRLAATTLWVQLASAIVKMQVKPAGVIQEALHSIQAIEQEQRKHIELKELPQKATDVSTHRHEDTNSQLSQ
jgi:hypothetical protein